MLPRFLKGRNITKIGIRPAAPAQDRHGIALVLIVRNEARHIAEWATFHHRAGVRHFIVYDNGSTDETIPAIRTTLPPAALTVIPWCQLFHDGRTGREIHNQVLAYAHAARNFGPTYRWMSFLDVDEFLVPVQASSLTDALDHLGDQRSLSLPWHMFGRNRHIEMPEGGVLENYTRRAADPMTEATGVRNFKQIVDPCHVTGLRVHAIEVDGGDKTCNDRGEIFRLRDRTTPAFYSADHLQLNHYYTRSDAELRAKIERGPNLTTNSRDHQRRVWRKVENIEKSEVEDRAALDYLARIGL